MRYAWTLGLVAAGCFNPSYGNGHLKCENGKTCQSGYHCAADDTCWKNGSDPVLDLAVTINPDGGALDAAMSPNDLTPVVDLSHSDSAVDLALPPIDMSQPDGNHHIELVCTPSGGAIGIQATGTHQATISIGQPLAGTASATGDHTIQLGVLRGTVSK